MILRFKYCFHENAFKYTNFPESRWCFQAHFLMMTKYFKSRQFYHEGVSKIF